MNVLVLLNTCPHPLDPGAVYAPKPVELSIVKVPAPRPDDLCRTLLSRELARIFAD